MKADTFDQFCGKFKFLALWNQISTKFILPYALQYHGGTNFGRTAGGPFIATSYDYDAPIDEYGMSKPKITI